MTTILERVLQPGALAIVFQPVVDADEPKNIRYFEAFARGPAGTSVETADVLFSYARHKHATAAVDRAAIRAALDAWVGLPPQSCIGLNVHAATLATDPTVVDLILTTFASGHISPTRLIVEIVEHSPPADVRKLREPLGVLRSAGVRIALDDVGRGHSNHFMVLECRPDILKADGHFVHGSSTDAGRQAILASISDLARRFGAEVVAEGVEAPEDLEAVRKADIGLAQGYFFARPAPACTWGEAA